MNPSTARAGSSPAPTAMHVHPVPGVPEVTAGDDLAALIDDALAAAGLDLLDGDVLVVSSKVVSKAAGLRAPAPTRVAAVLGEARRVVAERMTPSGITRVVESLAGPVLAAAGVDASNTGDADTVLLLPRDPDAAAERLRADLARRREGRGAPPARFGVVLSDTAGRPWRSGQVDFALGCAWVRGLDDLRGGTDADGRPLTVTARALADEVAAAADLVKGKSARTAAALVRGSGMGVDPGAPGARTLVRTGPADWFALGSLESVRAALGAPPGTAAAVEVGIPSAAGAGGDVDAAVERACRLATLRGSLGTLPPHHPRAAQVSNGLDPADVRTHVTQAGVRLEGDDVFALGLVTARLLVALEAEGVPARLADRSPGDRHALVVFA